MSAAPIGAAGAPGRTPADDARAARWLRLLCLFVVIASCAEFLIATTGVQIRHLPPSTDFATYYLAGAQAREGLSPYDRAALATRGRALGFTYDQFPFLYPPPFALAVEPLAHLSYPRARQVWMLLATLELFAALGCTAALLRRQARALGIVDERRIWILFTAFVPAALNSTSVHNDIRAGSVGALLFLALAGLAWSLVPAAAAPQGAGGSPARAWPAALATAVASLAKLTPAVFAVWLFARRYRRAAWLTVALVGFAMVPAVVHWGPGICTDYVRQALQPSLHDEVAPPMNQSLDAFLSRCFVPTVWVTPLLEAPWLKHILLAVLSVAMLGVTLAVLRRRAPAAGLVPVELGFVLLALLVLMKLTWVQTLTAMLFVWPVLMAALLRAAELERPWARRAGVWACAGFFLSSAHVPILWEPLRHGPLVLVTGVHLAGLVLLWGTAATVLLRGPELQRQPPARA